MLERFESEDLADPEVSEQGMEATFQVPADDEHEPPVIVQTIAFVDANQAIPLNWKLSNRQKMGYLLSWHLRAGAGTPLRHTLDRYFTRRSK